MIISTFRKTDQKGFPNAYFYATKNNLGTNILKFPTPNKEGGK